jgi:hypothetical protein
MQPDGLPRLLAFLHPMLALLTVGFLFHVASLGLGSRERGGERKRPAHARRAPLALMAAVLSAATGALATWLWRPDLRLAEGAHFWLGLAVVALLSIGALLSRSIPTSPLARRIHPFFGLAALLLSALQIFFGMPLLPF